MRTTEEMISFYESIFNADDLCYMVLGAMTSEEELENNENNQKQLLEISKFIRENINKIHFKTPELKETVKTFMENVPEIVERYKIENN